MRRLNPFECAWLCQATEETKTMCSQVRCPACGKPTWAGCGAHIEQALANVPEADRCKCREEAAAEVKAKAR